MCTINVTVITVILGSVHFECCIELLLLEIDFLINKSLHTELTRNVNDYECFTLLFCVNHSQWDTVRVILYVYLPWTLKVCPCRVYCTYIHVKLRAQTRKPKLFLNTRFRSEYFF